MIQNQKQLIEHKNKELGAHNRLADPKHVHNKRKMNESKKVDRILEELDECTFTPSWASKSNSRSPSKSASKLKREANRISKKTECVLRNRAVKLKMQYENIAEPALVYKTSLKESKLGETKKKRKIKRGNKYWNAKHKRNGFAQPTPKKVGRIKRARNMVRDHLETDGHAKVSLVDYSGVQAKRYRNQLTMGHEAGKIRKRTGSRRSAAGRLNTEEQGGIILEIPEVEDAYLRESERGKAGGDRQISEHSSKKVRSHGADVRGGKGQEGDLQGKKRGYAKGHQSASGHQNGAHKGQTEEIRGAKSPFKRDSSRNRSNSYSPEVSGVKGFETTEEGVGDDETNSTANLKPKGIKRQKKFKNRLSNENKKDPKNHIQNRPNTKHSIRKRSKERIVAPNRGTTGIRAHTPKMLNTRTISIKVDNTDQDMISELLNQHTKNRKELKKTQKRLEEALEFGSLRYYPSPPSTKNQPLGQYWDEENRELIIDMSSIAGSDLHIFATSHQDTDTSAFLSPRRNDRNSSKKRRSGKKRTPSAKNSARKGGRGRIHKRSDFDNREMARTLRELNSQMKTTATVQQAVSKESVEGGRAIVQELEILALGDSSALSTPLRERFVGGGTPSPNSGKKQGRNNGGRAQRPSKTPNRRKQNRLKKGARNLNSNKKSPNKKRIRRGINKDRAGKATKPRVHEIRKKGLKENRRPPAAMGAPLRKKKKKKVHTSTNQQEIVEPEPDSMVSYPQKSFEKGRPGGPAGDILGPSSGSEFSPKAFRSEGASLAPSEKCLPDGSAMKIGVIVSNGDETPSFNLGSSLPVVLFPSNTTSEKPLVVE